MFEARDQEDILAELQVASKVDASKIEGTFEYDVLASNSIEFAKVEIELQQAYKAAFADTSWNEYLSMRTEESGIIRKAAVKAIGTVTFTGTGTVAAGTLVATTAGTQFETTVASTITTSGDVAVEAVTAGTAGNVAAGAITVIPASISGITAVTHASATTDGYDEETDEALLTRYIIHVRTPGSSGNKQHYVEWAMEVAGCGGARVIRGWAGKCTVKVIIVDDNFNEASTALIQNVYNHIEEVRPVGAVVTVTAAKSVLINIAATYTGAADVAAFKAAVKSYLGKITKSAVLNEAEAYVSIARIGALLVDAGGVTDYSGLTLNGATGNIPMAEEEMPSMGEVVLSV